MSRALPVRVFLWWLDPLHCDISQLSLCSGKRELARRSLVVTVTERRLRTSPLVSYWGRLLNRTCLGFHLLAPAARVKWRLDTMRAVSRIKIRPSSLTRRPLCCRKLLHVRTKARWTCENAIHRVPEVFRWRCHRTLVRWGEPPIVSYSQHVPPWWTDLWATEHFFPLSEFVF